MTTPAEFAWESAERRCFEYLLSKLGDLEGVQGFLGELPRAALKQSELNMWFFEISGGGEVVRINPDQRPYNCWRQDAAVKGIFTELSLAQRVAGRLRDILPAGPTDQITGVERLDFTAQPILTRDIVELENDLESGGHIRVWRLEYGMDVTYHNEAQIA